MIAYVLKQSDGRYYTHDPRNYAEEYHMSVLNAVMLPDETEALHWAEGMNNRGDYYQVVPLTITEGDPIQPVGKKMSLLHPITITEEQYD